MLVLTRRIGHRLIIRDTSGEIDDVIVEVVRSRGRSELQLGITAPQRIKVLREEVADRPPRGPERHPVPPVDPTPPSDATAAKLSPTILDPVTRHPNDQSRPRSTN